MKKAIISNPLLHSCGGTSAPYGRSDIKGGVQKFRSRSLLRKFLAHVFFAFIIQTMVLSAVTAETEINNYTKIKLPDSSSEIKKEQSFQRKIEKTGYRLLNANKIDVRMIFLYKDEDKKYLRDVKGLTKRQIIVYKNMIKYASNDDELAAMLAREICAVNESYYGQFKGVIGGAQTKLAPKRFEIYFDKRAVDYMVQAGYNPLGLITYLHKSAPQKRFDRISRSNLTSKRLAVVYEYIFTKYPYFLKNNTYINNDVYQNFLLSSQSNREKLKEKVLKGSKESIKYE